MVRLTPRIIRRNDGVFGDVYFVDADDKRQYRRIVGGLAWPWDAENPGCLCILAESRFPTNTGDMRQWLLTEVVEGTASELLESAAALQDSYIPSKWLSLSTNHEMALLANFNRRRAQMRQPRLAVVPPPEAHSNTSDLLRFYMLILQEHLEASKTLFLGGRGVNIVNALATMDISSTSTNRVERNPPLAALLYALAELHLRGATGISTREESVRKAAPPGGY